MVAVPFSTGFNHTRIADEVNYKFQRCLAELALRPDTAMLPQLPLYGMGHSLGALLQVAFAVKCAPVLSIFKSHVSLRYVLPAPTHMGCT